MDFTLNPEQTLLKDSVERFVRERYPLNARRQLAASPSGYSEEHWRQMAELGWLAVGLPEAYGGIGGGAVETMVLMEAFGAGLVLEPYLPSVVLGGTLVTLAGSEAQKQTLLPALADGHGKLAFAYAERQSGYDLFDVQTTAKNTDGGYLLDGAKGVVLAASSADTLIVSARTAGDARDRDGIGLFLVDPKAPGVSLRGYATVDGLRAAELSLERAPVAADAVLGDPGGAYAHIERAAQRAIAALCAEAVGAMDAVVRATRDYLNTREQFGRPIGSFQALQHQFVDMHIALEEARSMAIVATLRVDEDDARLRARTLAGAKHLIGKHGRMIGQRGVQLHGGMGMSEEMAVGHYFKRLTMIDMMFGDHPWQLKHYAGL
jgi:alkylation response protein AidB-like acyl-CoA dehydrogenase